MAQTQSGCRSESRKLRMVQEGGEYNLVFWILIMLEIVRWVDVFLWEHSHVPVEWCSDEHVAIFFGFDTADLLFVDFYFILQIKFTVKEQNITVSVWCNYSLGLRLLKGLRCLRYKSFRIIAALRLLLTAMYVNPIVLLLNPCWQKTIR